MPEPEEDHMHSVHIEPQIRAVGYLLLSTSLWPLRVGNSQYPHVHGRGVSAPRQRAAAWRRGGATCILVLAFAASS